MSVGPTSLKFGYTNPLTGVFGPHPILGAVLDLNDAATFTLLSPDGLELSPPERSVVPTGNVRTQGERAVRAIYRHNRQVKIGLVLGPMQTYAGLASIVRTLLRWLSGPPQTPFCVQWQPPNASAPVYLDVVAAGHDLPADEADWLRLQLEPVAIELWVRPGLRGDLVRLSNLLSNPGFEAPMGGTGTAQSAPIAFSDPFTTLAQYTQIAGGAPSLNPANTFVDAILAQAGASLLRYYRLDEPSGTSAFDIGGQGQTGAYVGSPTLGAAGLITGDSDTAVALNGTSQYATIPTSGLPTGVGAWSLLCLCKPTNATNANNGHLITIGNPGTTAQAAFICQNVAGGWNIGTWGGANHDFDANGSSIAGHIYLVCGTFDGTHLTLYVGDITAGAGSPTLYGPFTPSTPNLIESSCALGTSPGTAFDFAGVLDECAVFGGSLTQAQVNAIYTAAKSGASGTLSNAMSIPAAAIVGFGSPAWGAIQSWQVRFRYVSGLFLRLYPHRVDSSHYLMAQVFSGGNGLGLFHEVAGTLNTLAQSTVTLTHEGWYWLIVTQFPAPLGAIGGDPPYLQATLYSDDNGAIGAQVAGGQIGAGAFDAVTALVGTAAIGATSQAGTIGGLASGAGGSGAGNQVALFGPGGWVSTPDAGTVPASGAWEQTAANTAPLGSVNAAGTSGPAGGVMLPVQSLGAARVDAPPVGGIGSSTGWLACWYSGQTSGGLAALQQSAIPVVAGGDALFFSGMVHATGNGAGYRMYAQVNEYSATGAFVASNQFTIASGAAAVPWQAWNWNYGATQPTTAYVVLILCVGDPGGSSNGSTTWFDNTQCWDVTASGVAATAGAMPYCELRSPNAPAQLLLSGVLGDLPSPAALAFGSYLSSWPLGSVLNFALGRAAAASSTAGSRLVGSSYGYFGAGGNPLAVAALDAAGYGGFYAATAAATGFWSPRPFSLAPADAPGVHHLFQRFWSGQSTANIANVQARANVLQRSKPWYGDLTGDDELWDGYGAYVTPLLAGSTWTLCDAGQLSLPPQALGALMDPTQNFLTPHAQWVDNTGGGSLLRASWAALLPIDGSLLVGVLNNPSNGTVAVAGQWVWAYFDALLTNRAGSGGGGDGPAWGYSIEASGAPNPAHAGGGPGTQTTGSININSGADPYLVLDPSVTVAQTGQAGVNQLVASLADGNAAVLPFAAEVAYYPLYLWPR